MLIDKINVDRIATFFFVCNNKFVCQKCIFDMCICCRDLNCRAEEAGVSHIMDSLFSLTHKELRYGKSLATGWI